MKKLMIALVAVAFATGVQAATVNWNEMNETYTPDIELASGSLYLIQTSAHSQDDFVSTLAGAATVAAFETTLQDWAIDQSTISDGVFDITGSSTSALTAKGAEQAYFAIVNGDRVFMSTEAIANYSEMGGADDYTFAYDFESTSYAAAMKAKDGNMGAGWYTTESVPEPTSGLLLLLGVAGLALKRKRA